jgi:hypothetical protein
MTRWEGPGLEVIAMALNALRGFPARGSKRTRVLGAAALLLAASASPDFMRDPGVGGAIIVLMAVPTATVAGGVVGAFSQHWTRIWWRPTGPDSRRGRGTRNSAGGPWTGARAAGVRAAQTVRSPDASLGIGVLSSAAPALAGLAISGGRNVESAVAIGAGLGVIADPAVGLASGGRGDLARRGLLVRGLAGGVAGASALAVANGREGGHFGAGGTAGVVVCSAAALVATVSWIHDLAITSSAVAGRPAARAGLTLRPDGRVAVIVSF